MTSSVIALGAGLTILQSTATAQQDLVDVPMFEVDPFWPKPLSGEAPFGDVAGVSVDAQDNVWVTHRGADGLLYVCDRQGDRVQVFTTDRQNERVRIVECATMTELTTFGRGGRQPSEFFGVHSIATDSPGNIYTTETYEGKRVQIFIYEGIGKVRPGTDQGACGLCDLRAVLAQWRTVAA